MLRGSFAMAVKSKACPFTLVSHTVGAPSPLVLKASFKRIRCRASRFFRYGRQTMACPCVQSRTWQKRPRPSSSKPLSRGSAAMLRASFAMAVKAWPAHSSSLALGRSALAPRPQSPFREDTMQSFALLSLWPSKARPAPLHSSRTPQKCPQPRLSARFKRKRRKASPRPPPKNAKPLSDLRLSQRKISAGRAAFNRAF